MAFDLDKLSWFHGLRMLLNECVTIVDITLHQLYFKAEYGPRPAGWAFDPDKLVQRQGRRLTDKLNWLAKITGKPLDDARDEVASFVTLKDIRNHFSHFDPLGPITLGGRKVDFVVAADMYRHPLMRRLLTATDTLPIQRNPFSHVIEGAVRH